MIALITFLASSILAKGEAQEGEVKVTQTAHLRNDKSGKLR